MFAAAMLYSTPALELSIYSTCKRISQKLMRNVTKFLALIYVELPNSPVMPTLRCNMEEVLLQGPDGVQDVRIVNSYPSQVELYSLFINFTHTLYLSTLYPYTLYLSSLFLSTDSLLLQYQASFKILFSLLFMEHQKLNLNPVCPHARNRIQIRYVTVCSQRPLEITFNQVHCQYEESRRAASYPQQFSHSSQIGLESPGPSETSRSWTPPCQLEVLSKPQPPTACQTCSLQ